jgi:PAS domain S-box-containing protein
MLDPSLVGLIYNAALLLMVAFIFNLAADRWYPGELKFSQVPMGIILGAIGIIVMMTHWKLHPGLVFDMRSVLIGISGLFFGSLATGIAMLFTAAFRFYQGGMGTWAGISVILASGIIGISWRHYRRESLSNLSFGELYLFGMVIHLVMLAIMVALPREIAWNVLSTIFLPVLLINPICTALLGILIVKRLQRVIIEAELRERDAKFQSLFDNIMDAVLLTEPDGAVLAANPGACRIFGRTEEEICRIGRACIIDPDDPRLPAALEERSRTGRFHGELTFVRKDGTRFPGEISSVVFRDRNGDLKTSMIIHDITARKRTEQALRERDIQFTKLSSHVPGMIYQFMRKPDGSYCVPFSTEAIRNIFGCSPEDVHDDFSPVTRVIYPEDLNRLIGSIEHSAEWMTTWQCEYRVQLPGREIRWMSGYSTPERLADGSILWHGFNTDITERKRTEEEIRKRDSKYEQLVEHAEDGIFTSNMDGKFILANEKFCRMMGWSKEECLRHNVLDTYPEDVRVIGMRRLAGLQQGETLRFERPMRRPDGGMLYVEANAWKDDDGNLQAIVRDITDRKRADESLRDAETRYRMLFEHSPDGIVIIDPATARPLEFNETACRQLGYSRDEFSKLSISDLEVDETPDETRARIEQVVREGHADFETRQRTKRGEVRKVHVIAQMIDIGEKRLYHCIWRDITDRKNMENALRQSEELYRNLFDRHSAVKLLIDPDTGRIIDANDAAVKFYGWPHETLTRMMIQEINTLPPEEVKKEMEKVGTDNAIQFEFRHRIADGSVRNVEVFSSKVEVNGKDLLHSIIHDVTESRKIEDERKKLESQLQQSQKMEAVGQLAGGIAHDFNNLLMTMQGNVSMMLEDIDPFHRHNDYLKSIEVQIRSAANLTRQLLGFAREGRYNVKPVDMNEILETNVSMFERTKKEIRIHRDYEKDLWLVDADADQMGQVFINTFVNAWQAMPAGGDLQVETKNVILDEMHVRPHMLTPGRYVRVAVTDTGIGMDERTKQRIFEPFFTTKQRGQGTGLGLAMVYGIIKGHHGFINVYSEPGRGSTFNIYLPVSQKEVSPEAPENQEIVRGTGTILLVDDEAQVLKASQRMLEHLGYTVIPAQGGKEAINLYEGKKEGIDLVLLDLVMPDMSGKKVFQHLRHVNPEIKVILLSGYSKNETTQEILESGARGFLQKPASLKELSQKIHEVLRAGNGSDPQGKIH